MQTQTAPQFHITTDPSMKSNAACLVVNMPDGGQLQCGLVAKDLEWVVRRVLSATGHDITAELKDMISASAERNSYWMSFPEAAVEWANSGSRAAA